MVRVVQITLHSCMDLKGIRLFRKSAFLRGACSPLSCLFRGGTDFDYRLAAHSGGGPVHAAAIETVERSASGVWFHRRARPFAGSVSTSA
jgi:hypothetical protein